MKLKNVLIVVKDIEKAKEFYHDVFGLDVILNSEGNVILTEGLVLQEAELWKSAIGQDIISENNSCALYFEECDFEGFVEKLERLYPEIKYATRPINLDWGQKLLRMYDLDGNLIEVRTPIR